MSCKGCSGCKCQSQSTTRVRHMGVAPQPLSDDEVNNLIAAVGDDPKLKLVTLLMLNAGLRRGEISRLKWNSFDLAAGTISVAGKGGTRSVPLDEVLRQSLTAVNHNQPPDTEHVLGTGSATALRKVQNSLRKISGDGRLLRLRHTWAHRLVYAGISAPVLMAVGGWSFTGCPKALVRLTTRRITEEYRRAHEAARKEN